MKKTKNDPRCTLGRSIAGLLGGAFMVTGSLNAAAANKPPVISGVPAIKIKVGAPFNFVPVASDPDGDPLTFSITNKPSWMIFNPANGALSGTPADGNIGLTPVAYTISVSDGKGGTAGVF